MEFKQLNDKIDNLNKLIANHQLGEFFKEVNRTIDDNKALLQLKDKVRKQLEIYNNLLKYSFTTIKNPEKGCHLFKNSGLLISNNRRN
jgi:hypothetical protein